MTDKTKAVETTKKGLHKALTEDEYANLGQIKKLYAPEANEAEFFGWIRRCHRLGVHIYQNESFCVVHSPNDPKKRKAVYIDSFPLWNRLMRSMDGFKGIKCQPLYSKDKFKMTSEMEKPEHEWSEVVDRGELLGAYVIIEIEGQVPFYEFYKWKEFKKSGAEAFMHEKMPEHMIKKIAKMNGARNVCSELGNSYDESEINFTNGVIIDAEVKPAFPMPGDESKGETEPDQPQEQPEEPGGKKGNTLFDKPKKETGKKADLFDLVDALFSEIETALVQESDAWLKSAGYPTRNDITSFDKFKELQEKWLERTE